MFTLLQKYANSFVFGRPSNHNVLTVIALMFASVFAGFTVTKASPEFLAIFQEWQVQLLTLYTLGVSQVFPVTIDKTIIILIDAIISTIVLNVLITFSKSSIVRRFDKHSHKKLILNIVTFTIIGFINVLLVVRSMNAANRDALSNAAPMAVTAVL